MSDEPTDTDVEILEGASVVPRPTQEHLSDQQYVDYRGHRREFIRWLANLGKDEARAEGYSEDVVKRRAGDCDRFYRWAWENETDGYTTNVTTDHADAYCRELAMSDRSSSDKNNIQLSLKSLFDWQDVDWTPDISFHGDDGTSQPRDYLTRAERQQVREAVLEWDSTPAYAAMSPQQRHRWKGYIATRLGKSTGDVSPEDFDAVNGFKYTSLLWTTLDAGLRPVEVKRAKTYWVDLDNAVLRIPREESSKNDGNWVVSLRERTAEMLDHWLDERELYPKYDDSDRLWLTENSNPYTPSSLRYVMNKVVDLADIDERGRSLSWYAIRHSVGTYLAREEGLAAAQSQLRHTSIDTTAKYDQAPIEDRRDALDDMG
ncbi:site-specific integrase [Salarchaeum sp. JOR-1]|uniref:tyrosine-type recombinase/integrase n=1 Tax=Salarchaeum sp. JOR-1 TaxID=2599399 RepID=UPI00119850D0|nr:site-specific integrase [Salarchaeum sp. JOR-1]